MLISVYMTKRLNEYFSPFQVGGGAGWGDGGGGESESGGGGFQILNTF